MNDKTTLSLEQVRHVATLARLKLSKDEESLFSTQLSSILDFIGQLNELDTSSVEPTSSSLDIKNVFRDDTAKALFEKNAWSKNAPAYDHDHIRVPRVIE